MITCLISLAGRNAKRLTEFLTIPMSFSSAGFLDVDTAKADCHLPVHLVIRMDLILWSEPGPWTLLPPLHRTLVVLVRL